MDIRKIQVTGGSSYMITLPKDWVESVGLRKNDPVNVQVQSDRSLSVYPSSPSPAGRWTRRIASRVSGRRAALGCTFTMLDGTIPT